MKSEGGKGAGTATSGRLIPMTILDCMVLVAGCAVSAWLLRMAGANVIQPRDLLDWVILTAYILYGLTTIAPVALAVQFLRGRRQRLFPGEIAWLIIGLELLPFVMIDEWWPASGGLPRDWYLKWLLYVSPFLVLCCTAAAFVWDRARGWPTHWSDRLGLAISLAQCVPSGLLITGLLSGR